MKKKTISMITALAVGGTMLVGTAAFAVSQSSGYTVYKDAVKAVPDLKDATAKVNFTVTDNNKVILSGNDLTKFNKANNAMSSVTELKYGSKDVKVESYSQDGKLINKGADSDVYTVREGFAGKRDERKTPENNAAVKQGFEGLFDAYVGNRSNDFSVTTNSDGSKTVSVNLNENEITPLDNAIVSFVVKAAGVKGFEGRKDASMADLKALVPQLSSDIKITAVNATAVINNNTFKSQDASITITGKDASGSEHSVVINANIDLSNVGSTTPDKVNLTGKQVKTVSFKGHRD